MLSKDSELYLALDAPTVFDSRINVLLVLVFHWQYKRRIE